MLINNPLEPMKCLVLESALSKLTLFIRALEKKIKKIVHSTSFSGKFRGECKLILYLPTLYLYCVYPTMSKCSKQLPSCMKIAETSVVLIVFNEVLCEVRAYTVTFSYRNST